MKLKIDASKTYAVALQGGGARGAYETGIWQAMDELGIRYNAVAGTSVGALNGAVMAMRDLKTAEDAWINMDIKKVINVSPENEEDLEQILKGEITADNITSFVPAAVEVLKKRGLDVEPLRNWMRGLIDTKKIKESDVELYVTIMNLSDFKGSVVKVNDLPESEIADMILASAYHPVFRLEKLGDSFYTDGGFVDALPIGPLAKAGYKDIIAVHIPGIGNYRPEMITSGVNVTLISPRKSLGKLMNFTAEQSRRNLKIGYLDGMRAFCGLKGKDYYIERTLSEVKCMEILVNYIARTKNKHGLREIIEVSMPAMALRLGVPLEDYGGILDALCESIAAEKKLDDLKIYTDEEMVELCIKEINTAEKA